MILKLFFLDISSNKYKGVWDHILLWEKKPPRLSENRKRNYLYWLEKNLLNLIKKQDKKSKYLIDKKSSKLDKKLKKKTDYLFFCKKQKIF